MLRYAYRVLAARQMIVNPAVEALPFFKGIQEDENL
jgi:hypothetical protein